jgi:hypothetical protein
MSTPLDIRRVEPIGQPVSDAIVLSYQRTRLILMTVLSLAFAVVGLVLVIVGDGGARIGGALAVLFFGGGAIALGTMAAQPGTIAFTRHGLAGETRWARTFVPWTAVIGVHERWIGSNPMVVIDVDDPARLVTSRGIGWLKSLNGRAGFPDLAFPSNLLGESAPILVHAVTRYATDPEARARIGTPGELQALLGVRPATGSSVSGGLDVARVLLWIIGVAALLLAAVALTGDADPGREGSRATGSVLIGGIGFIAVAGAWLLPRRPRIGRIVGLVASAGILLIGWILTQTTRGGLASVIVGVAVVIVGLVIGQRLLRGRLPRPVS